MSASDEKARRADVGLNFEAFSETNNSTVPRAIEPARQRYLARRVQALGGRALFELFFPQARLSPVGFRSMRRSIPRSWPPCRRDAPAGCAIDRRGGVMNSRLDFANVNAAALGAFPAALSRLLPGGRIDGREFVALNPRRNDNRLGSFKIRLSGPRAGSWADFATSDKGGDPVSLVARREGCSQPDAARLLGRMLCAGNGEGAR
jgi:hypothetical protein